jgi:hypothetical protein
LVTQFAILRDTRLLDIDGHKNPKPIPQPKDNFLITKTVTILAFIYGMIFLSPIAEAKAPMKTGVIALAPLSNLPEAREAREGAVEVSVFKHGNIDWLPELAIAAGWKPAQFKKLGNIILRESGGCPNRIGSSIVDKNCNITGYTKATNKSDSGLLQINGVNWDLSRNKNAIACTKLGFCTQEAMLDPLNNLKVGRLLFEAAGWEPWNACNWDPTRC